MKKVVIIGSGFAGLSASCFLAKAGYDVTVLEKNATPGGRARQLMEDGFTFDIGPSWYWMPDIFEIFFNCFGKKVADYYQLLRLDPSYKIYWKEEEMEVPADYESLKILFEKIEPGSGKQLDKFLDEAKYKYEIGINKLVQKPGLSVTEFLDLDVILGVFKLDVFTSMRKHVGKFFKNKKLVELIEFPILFLGAMSENIPALYSLMNYADIKLGTWYPQGGMYKIVEGMYSLAKELGVNFYFNYEVTKIDVEQNMVNSLSGRLLMDDRSWTMDDGQQTTMDDGRRTTEDDGRQKTNLQPSTFNFPADAVIASADYHFVETVLLEKQYRSYSEAYWNKKIMAPSCLIFYIGLNKKLEQVHHHMLFFDSDFQMHGEEIYTNPSWPSDPLFYVCIPSVTDKSVAPEGCENLFFLIPIAAGLQNDNETIRDLYFNRIIERFENKTGQSVSNNIIYKKSYSISNFEKDYNAFKGNAYGLANTLMQTAIFKPSCRSKKLKNLFYAGQLTVPGPGVPPSLIGGQVVAKELIKQLKNFN